MMCPARESWAHCFYTLQSSDVNTSRDRAEYGNRKALRLRAQGVYSCK